MKGKVKAVCVYHLPWFMQLVKSRMRWHSSFVNYCGVLRSPHIALRAIFWIVNTYYKCSIMGVIKHTEEISVTWAFYIYIYRERERERVNAGFKNPNPLGLILLYLLNGVIIKDSIYKRTIGQSITRVDLYSFIVLWSLKMQMVIIPNWIYIWGRNFKTL